MEETVTIPKSKYDALRQDTLFLEALRQLGVDNWEGFSEAHKLVKEWEAEDANH